MLRRLLAIALATLLLAGCLKPLTSVVPRLDRAATAQSQGTLRGQIGTMRGYHAQLTNLLDEFARGATVSLIEVSSGNTVGTSIADASGSFVINFGFKFSPKRTNPTDARSVAYYLEAVKGLAAGNPQPNQAGADAMRLRTLIWFDFTAGGWVSLGNPAPGPINVSLGTTAVAFYINQQIVNGQAVTPEAYIGSLDVSVDPPAYAGPGPGVVGLRNLASTDYSDLYLAVVNAVAKDQDPLHVIVLSPGGGVVNTQTSFTFAGMTPASGGIGSTVTMGGTGFEPTNPNFAVVFVGEATGTIDVGQSSSTKLVVTVPPGARSGLVRLTLPGINTYTPTFTVTTHDGHQVFHSDAGGNTTLYAVSNTFGTLLQVNPDGSTVTLSSALSAPRGVLVNPEGGTGTPFKIYVANGDNHVVQMDSTGAVLDAAWLNATDPYALALGPDGDLYVAEKSANRITRVDVDWTTGTASGTVAVYTGFSNPSALAFDHNRYAYVVETDQGRIVRFQPQASDTGTVALSPVVYPTPAVAPNNCEVWAYVPDPKGVAIDTAGNLFVTSQSNNVVMRVDPVGNMSAFAGVSGASAIARDAAGNLYVGEQTRNLIRRITLAGDQRVFAYGLSGLRGLAVDGASNLYVALSNAGAILKVSSDRKTTVPLISGIAPPSGLTFRNGKLYVAHNDAGSPNKAGGSNEGASIDEVELTGAARSVITSGLYWPGAAEVSDDGSTFYVGRIYGTYGAWTDSKWWFDSWERCGINIINPGLGTNVQRRPLVPQFHGGSYWNSLGQSSVQLDADHWLFVSSARRKLVMSTRLNGRNATQKWEDLTPSFGGTNVFPNDLYDVVYDGLRYVYVSCRDGNIYRFDATDFSLAPTTIAGFAGYPFGMTMVGPDLFVTDQGSNRIYKVASPDGTPVLSSTLNVAQPRGITTYGGMLYVSDYTNRQIVKVNPADWTATPYLAGLNGSPSRIRAFNDGRLLVRVSDWVIYQISNAATPAAATYASAIGCGGCDRYDFFIDGANTVWWGEPMGIRQNGNNGWIHSHQVIRDRNAAGDDWLYVGTTGALYGMNLSKGEDLVINGIGNVYGVAVDPDTDVLYTGSTGGEIYAIDPVTRAITNGPDLNVSIWGMVLDNASNLLYAAASGNNSLYQVDPGSWTQTQLKVGLHTPMF